MFAPRFEPPASCSSKLSLSGTCLVCCLPLTPFSVVGTVAGIEQSQQSTATVAAAQTVDEHAFQSKRVLTEAQSTVVSLEPAFEHLLCDVGFYEPIIWALAQMDDRETFSGLLENPSELRDLVGYVGIDVSGGGMPHRRELAKVPPRGSRRRHKRTLSSRRMHCRSNTAKGSPCCRKTGRASWFSLKPSTATTRLMTSCWTVRIFEEFQERLAAGRLRAEPVDQVISEAEVEEQDRAKPEPARQYGIHSDSKLTLQTHRKYTSRTQKM